MNKILSLAAAAAVYAMMQHFFGAAAHGLVLATAFIGWVDGNVSSVPQKRGEPGIVAGGQVFEVAQSWAKKTTDGNGTIYFLASLPSDAILTSLLLNNDALTGCTSADLGIFKMDKSLSNLGTVSATAGDYYAGASTTGLPNSTPVDAGAILMSAVDINAGKANGSEQNGLANITVQTVTTLGATTAGFLNLGLKLWQLLGFTDPKWKEDSYVLGMRLNTAGSAAGNLAIRGRYIQG